MTENNQNVEALESYEEQIAKLAAKMSDDEVSDDLQEKKENQFLFPPIEPHYRNDSK
jgi:hypothetical protein